MAHPWVRFFAVLLLGGGLYLGFVSAQENGADKKAPVRRVRVTEIFNRPIQTQQDLDEAITQLRDALQKYIDEGAAIILE